MELPEIKDVETQSLDLWFSNIVDTINYNLGQIQGAVPTLDKQLTTVDTAPIQYLKDSLNDLTKSVNSGFDQISDKLRSFDSRISAMESKGAKGGE